MKNSRILACAILLGLLSWSTVQAGAVLDGIISSNTIKIATNANWPPQSFINADNQLDGFDVDVAREIAKRLGVKSELGTLNRGVVSAGNWNRRWAMHVGSMTATKNAPKNCPCPRCTITPRRA